MWQWQYPMAERQGPRRAVAQVRGGPLAPQLRGTVTFTEVAGGVWVAAVVEGLPAYRPGGEGRNPIGPHGFHIHERGDCSVGDPAKPFEAAGGHWNPTGQPHGNHAGDFPVLIAMNGRAVLGFFTNRFRVADVIGKAVVIHESPDDYRSQPAGDAGRRLGCGVIR